MTRTFNYSLAAAFIAAFCFNSSKAEHFPEGHGAPPVIHRPNPFPGHGPLHEHPDGHARYYYYGGGGANGISYHGGPIMLGQVNVYAIWYGTWNTSSKTIVTDFLNYIGGSPYYAINTTYYNGSGSHLQNLVHYAGSAAVGYSHGTVLSDSQIQQIVSEVINSGSLPKDGNGIYFVLTSADVSESSGFCTQYCGWATHCTTASS